MVAKQDNGGTAPTANKTRLVIAEEQALFAGGLPGLLHRTSSGGIEVVQICPTRVQLFRTLRKTTPDVLLCDVWMPNNSGNPAMPCNASSLEAIKRLSPNTAILLLSGKWDATLVKNLLDSRADGFLDKDVTPEQVYQAIEQVRRGNRYITSRLRTAIKLLNTGSNESIRAWLLKGRRGEVLRLLLEGHSPTEIADMLPVGKKEVDRKIAEDKSMLGIKTHIRIQHACIELGIAGYNTMVADNADNIPHYDAALALGNAGDDPAMRDEIVNGALDEFSKGGELAALFNVSLYRITRPKVARWLTVPLILQSKRECSGWNCCVRNSTPFWKKASS